MNPRAAQPEYHSRRASAIRAQRWGIRSLVREELARRQRHGVEDQHDRQHLDLMAERDELLAQCHLLEHEVEDLRDQITRLQRTDTDRRRPKM